MSALLLGLLADFEAEARPLVAVVAGLAPAATDPDRFAVERASAEPAGRLTVDDAAAEGAAAPAGELLARWRASRTPGSALRGRPTVDPLPWFGLPMSAASMTTARLMETWDAQGPDADRWLDVAQAFAGPPGTGGPPRTAPLPTPFLQHPPLTEESPWT